MKVFKPRKIRILNEKRSEISVGMVACGMFHSVIIDREYKIYAAGLKKYAGFELSNEAKTNEISDFFQRIPLLRKLNFITVSCGEFHTMALSERKDEIYGWGSIHFGKLGIL